MIVQGDEGLGDPEFLFQTLRGPKFSARATLKHIDLVSLPLLRENSIVIVEKAREMSVEDIKMFMDYVNLGGKMVWVGDAGTKTPLDESDDNYFLSFENRGSEQNGFIGPWARRNGDFQVSLDYLLGVNFKSNYCDLVDCSNNGLIGHLNIVDSDEKIVYGISQGLPLYGNFSIVETSSEAYQSALAFMDNGTDLIATPPTEYFWLNSGRTNFGGEFPVIVSSGVGGRVVYYAFPPEYFVSDEMPIDEDTGERIQYWALFENMYYGMLYK